MDIIQLYMDYSVDFQTEGHKHCRPGWVNVPCPSPFCRGNAGYHLGFELANEHYFCWRCGWKPLLPTLAAILNISVYEVEKVSKIYGSYLPGRKSKVPKVNLLPFKLPSHTEVMRETHRRYLAGRCFDPDKLEREWGLLGTGPVASLTTKKDGKEKEIDYRFRIVIPYMWDGQMISFDSRDITGKTEVKYIACPLDREIISHKEILYGDQTAWGETGIAVEGTTDVWRMGKQAFAVSGIEYKQKQVRLIAKNFKRVAVLFDGASDTSKEGTAFLRANTLVGDLKFRGVDAFRIDIQGDPASLPQAEADYIVKQINK